MDMISRRLLRWKIEMHMHFRIDFSIKQRAACVKHKICSKNKKAQNLAQMYYEIRLQFVSGHKNKGVTIVPVDFLILSICLPAQLK